MQLCTVCSIREYLSCGCRYWQRCLPLYAQACQGSGSSSTLRELCHCTYTCLVSCCCLERASLNDMSTNARGPFHWQNWVAIWVTLLFIDLISTICFEQFVVLQCTGECNQTIRSFYLFCCISMQICDLQWDLILWVQSFSWMLSIVIPVTHDLNESL